MTADPTAGDTAPSLPPELTASLVLVRHGESTWITEGRFQGRADPPLSAIGERQARLVGQRLADPARMPALPIPDGPPVAVWHSPLSRARQTAEAIASLQPEARDLRSIPALTEVSQGDWEGRTHEEVQRTSPEALAAWRRDPLRANAPGGEPIVDAALRVRAGLEEIISALVVPGMAPAAVSPVPGYRGAGPARPWGLVVAHDGISRLALLALLRVPLERFWSFPFVLCGITVLELRDGRASLLAHNVAAHLAPLAAEATAATEARDRAGAL